MRKYGVFFLAVFLTGCQFPEDPNQTLQHIKESQRLRAGLCTELKNSNEKEFLKSLSTALNVAIVWVYDTQEHLYSRLEQNELDVVSCDIKEDSPWKDRLAFSAPVPDKSYVLALPQGENAWLHFINTFIYREQSNASHQ